MISDPGILFTHLWDKGISVSDTFYWLVSRCRYMFYLASPSETMFPDVSQVPRLVVEVCSTYFLPTPQHLHLNCL